jgi:hypothetical protein
MGTSVSPCPLSSTSMRSSGSVKSCVVGERVAVTTAKPGVKIPNADPCEADAISPESSRSHSKAINGESCAP